MPQRLLRPSIRQSKRWNRIPFLAQTLYIRLLTLVDDYARYDADAELLTSECFPFGDPDGNPLPVLTVDSALLTLVSKDMLILYEHDGKRYLQLTRWQERVRSESKWPDPKKSKMLTFDNTCCQMIASPPSPSPSPSPQPKTVAEAPLPVPESLRTEEFMRQWAIWQTHRRVLKGVKNWEAMFSEQLEFLARHNSQTAVEIIKTSIRNGWKGLFEPKNGNATGRTSRGEVDRNAGTANAGQASNYKFPAGTITGNT